jgi:uncharacterized membrane protein YgcG
MSRLRQRVQRLENSKTNRCTAVIVTEVGETVEEAKVRHFDEHPEERDASNVLLVQLVDPTVRD